MLSIVPLSKPVSNFSSNNLRSKDLLKEKNFNSSLYKFNEGIFNFFLRLFILYIKRFIFYSISLFLVFSF